MFLGRIGTPSPVVLLMAPLNSAGAYKGYCTGVVGISQVSGLLANLMEKDLDITVTDGREIGGGDA
jgi:hypothetical protein